MIFGIIMLKFGIGTSEPRALFNVNGEALIGGNTLRYVLNKTSVTGTDKGILYRHAFLLLIQIWNVLGRVISEGYTRVFFIAMVLMNRTVK